MRKFCFGFLLIFLTAFGSLARADFDADMEKPLALLEQSQYAQALEALDALAPRYPDEFLLYYARGAAQLGLLDDKAEIAFNIATAQKSRASLLRARQLAGDSPKALQAVAPLIETVEKVLRALNAPFEAETKAIAGDKDAEIAALKAKLAELEAPKKATAKAPANANASAATKPLSNPKLPKLAPRPGYIIGRCVDMRGKPLSGVGIRVFGTTQAGGEKTSFDTKTDAAGKYAVKLPQVIFISAGRIISPTRPAARPTRCHCIFLMAATTIKTACPASLKIAS